MADHESTGAVHLTTLDLDVSKIFEQLNQINQKVQETAEQIRNTNIVIGGSTDGSTQNPLGNISQKTQQAVGVTKSSIESLNLAYKNFQNTLAKSKLNDALGTQLSKIKSDVDANASSMRLLTAAVQSGNPITKEMVEEYRNLASALKTSKGELKDAETNAIKTGQGFKDLGSQAKNAGGLVSNLLVRLADKAKWMLAFQLVSLVRNAFHNIIGTIKDTEDSVVELQRVLNESIDGSVISKELYSIGAEFGRSFEDVQEVAVKFAQTGKSWNEVIDATRATMLGLNTAELEVSTATQGLIAVMTQFNIEASELELVIDKINITADNFPITSEKIVAALQRAGGTAYNFGLTLEETIGIITALGEATGRSGENIGTALNSLISFSMKSSSLKTFSKFLGDIDLSSKNVLEIWQMLGDAINGNEKAIGEMMASSEEFSDLFNEELATSIGLTEEYNKAMMNSQDVYSTVGTYRQNYFIALLKNIDEVINVLNNMTYAEGYSLQENEKYMDTLTAHVEQLKIAAGELAVQFGESGFLEFAKDVVDAITGIIKLTESIGGLKTVLYGLTAAMVAVKTEKIAQFLADAPKRFQSLITGLKNIVMNLNPAIAYQNAYNASLERTALAAKAAKTELEREAIEAKAASTATAAGITAIASSFLMIGTVITALIGIWNSYQQHLKEVREEHIRLGKEAEESSKKVSTAYNAYLKTIEDGYSKTSIEVKNAQDEVLKSLGYSEEAIESLRKKYDDLDGQIQKLIKTEQDETRTFLERRKIAAEESLKDIEAPYGLNQDNIIESIKEYYLKGPIRSSIDLYRNFDKLMKELNQVDEDIRADISDLLVSVPDNVDDARIALETLDDAIDDLRKSSDNIGDSELFRVLVELRSNIKEKLDEIDSATEALDNFWKTEDEATDATGRLADSFGTLNVKDLEDQIKALGDAFDILSGKVDSFQSAYKSIIDIIDEYNRTGEMSVDNLQTLLGMEPEYLALIEEKNGKLSINKEKLDELIAANNDYLLQMEAIQIAEQIEIQINELMTKTTSEMTLEEIKASMATQILSGDLADAAYAFLKGKDDGTKLNNVLSDMAYKAGLAGNQIGYLTTKVWDSVNAIANLVSAGNSTGGESIINPSNFTVRNYVPSVKTSTRTSTPNTESAFEKEKKAFDDLLDRYEDEIYFMEKRGEKAEDIANKYLGMQNLVHERAEKLRKQGYTDESEEIRELQKQWWKYAEERIKAYKKVVDETLSLYDDQIYFMEQKNSGSGGIIATYRKMQEEVHELAETYRSMGLSEESEYIRALQKLWLQYQEQIEKVYKDETDLIIDKYETEIYFLEKLGGTEEEIIEKRKAIQQELHEQAEKYREVGYDEEHELIKDTQKEWQEQQQEIFNTAKEFSDKRISLLEDELFFSQKKGLATTESTVEQYRKMQEEVHRLADWFRSQGVDEDSELIKQLQRAWWSYQDAIEEVVNNVYNSNVTAFQNAISQLEYEYGQLERLMDYSGMEDNLHEQLQYFHRIRYAAMGEYNRLINQGKDINDELVQATIQTFNNATEQIQSLSKKIADNLIKIYDDFISLADSLDVWDSLDFTKLEYLEDKLKDINRLYEEGKLSLADYKELLEDTGVAIYNARKAELEQQKKDIQDQYNEIIDGYKEQIELIKKQKDDSDKYYDDLIANLRKVEESNSRINAQLDYYANRQKILRNLEQAQARSGVEWREKEIQYQEELSKLDEDWRRQQEQWNISDQIEALEKLKQEASDRFEESIARIEEYIKNAEEKSKQAIDVISAQIDEIGKKIFDYIQETVDKAKEAAQMSQVIPTIQNQIAEMQQYILTGWKALTDDMAKLLKNSIVEGASVGASEMQTILGKTLSTIKNSINSVMQQKVAEANPNLTQTEVNKTASEKLKDIGTAAASVVNVVANVASPSSANTFVNALSKLLTNPSRF